MKRSKAEAIFGDLSQLDTQLSFSIVTESAWSDCDEEAVSVYLPRGEVDLMQELAAVVEVANRHGARLYARPNDCEPHSIFVSDLETLAGAAAARAEAEAEFERRRYG